MRYESTAEPVLMLKCHCRDCQQLTGGPYVPAVIFSSKTFRVTQGAIQRHSTPSEGGGDHLRGFCPKCGSRLTGAEDAERGTIGVVASSLDDPGIFKPKFEMYVEDAQPWDFIDPATHKFPQHFSREKLRETK